MKRNKIELGSSQEVVLTMKNVLNDKKLYPLVLVYGSSTGVGIVVNNIEGLPYPKLIKIIDDFIQDMSKFNEIVE